MLLGTDPLSISVLRLFSYRELTFYFSGDEDDSEFENQFKEPIIEIKASIFREARIHPHELDFGEFDNKGDFLAIGGIEYGKIFLCDTQSQAPTGLMMGNKPGPTRKKGAFKPSFGG